MWLKIKPFLIDLLKEKTRNSYVELLISPFTLLVLSILFGKLIILIWTLLFSNNYAPTASEDFNNSLYASISILISSHLMLYFIHNPSRYIYAVALPINFGVFTLLATLLAFSRLPYLRPDLLSYFFSSTSVMSYAIWVHEARRKYVYYRVPIGRPLILKNRNNVRIVGEKIFGLSERYTFLNKVDGIVVDFNAPLSKKWEKFIADVSVKGIKIYDRNEIIERFDGFIQIEYFAQVATHWRAGFDIYKMIKRSYDFILAILCLPIFLFIIFISAILIKIDSPGPILFKQKRLGLFGQEFVIYKLRTMYHELEPKSIVNARINDSRITRVGNFLRKTRIDELPQIFNILKGEMSWIGPRPETAELAAIYEKELPFYRYRYSVRPGITGWAAVNQGYVGSISETSMKINYDLFYINNLRLELDMIIVFRTIMVIFSGFGAR